MQCVHTEDKYHTHAHKHNCIVKNDQRMSWRGAADKMEDVTESERRIIREPLILGHPSPCALLSSSHFYPLICKTQRLSYILFLAHVVITQRSTRVSADADHHGFTRPGAKGQGFISQLSCDVWTEECTHLDFYVSLCNKAREAMGKQSDAGCVHCNDAK